jgi:hypothetical protein
MLIYYHVSRKPRRQGKLIHHYFSGNLRVSIFLGMTKGSYEQLNRLLVFSWYRTHTRYNHDIMWTFPSRSEHASKGSHRTCLWDHSGRSSYPLWFAYLQMFKIIVNMLCLWSVFCACCQLQYEYESLCTCFGISRCAYGQPCLAYSLDVKRIYKLTSWPVWFDSTCKRKPSQFCTFLDMYKLNDV